MHLIAFVRILASPATAGHFSFQARQSARSNAPLGCAQFETKYSSLFINYFTRTGLLKTHTHTILQEQAYSKHTHTHYFTRTGLLKTHTHTILQEHAYSKHTHTLFYKNMLTQNTHTHYFTSVSKCSLYVLQ